MPSSYVQNYPFDRLHLMEQIASAIGIIFNPKKTLIELPSDKFYVFSFLVYLLLIISKIIPANIPKGLSRSEILFSFIPLITMSVIIFFLVSYLIKYISKLFGKNISTKKILNIVGYSQIPRVILAFPVSLMFKVFPILSEHSILIRVLNFCTLLLGIYAFILLIYGLIICPEDKQVLDKN